MMYISHFQKETLRLSLYKETSYNVNNESTVCSIKIWYELAIEGYCPEYYFPQPWTCDYSELMLFSLLFLYAYSLNANCFIPWEGLIEPIIIYMHASILHYTLVSVNIASHFCQNLDNISHV